MTNEQFAKWRESHFPRRSVAARALGINHETVAALESGVTRKGKPYPVPLVVELACAAWSLNVRAYDGADAEQIAVIRFPHAGWRPTATELPEED